MKRPPKCHVVDFETDPIQQRPEYPPKPVSVSIQKIGERKPKFYAWGHYTGEHTCSKADAKRALAEVWNSGEPIIFQNAKFDVDVAVTHMGMKMLPWERIHDTMYLLYLYDPHAPDLQLKPSAERILGEAPEERDAMTDWLWQNKKRLLAETDIAKWADNKGKLFINSKTKLGALVSYAPAPVAGPYANGDVTRTLALFNKLWPEICERGMQEAYDRERELMPILLENERVGIRVDTPALEKDVALYGKALEGADRWLRKALGADISLDDDVLVAEALANAGLVRDEDWTWTKGGNGRPPQRSVAKGNLRPDMIQDPRVAQAFGYRNRLQTCLKMFMQPWLDQSQRRGDDHVSTNWNQVRNPQGGGTRTGRPSTSNPNFLNISKTWGVDDGYIHPKHLKVLELPLVRKYMLPDKGHTWLHRDFNSQELRILAHLEDAELMAAYTEDPWLDVHQFVANMIEDKTGKKFARKNVKIANFRIIYGGGAPATAAGIGCSLQEAKDLLDAHAAALPSIRGRNGITSQITNIGKSGESIITWGGREYYSEPAKFDPRFGRVVDQSYKLTNYACQGGAADATKEAIIRYYNHPKRKARFLVTVYDEINSSSPTGRVRPEMEILRESMEGLEFDVPMLSEGKIGVNWASLESYDDKRK